MKLRKTLIRLAGEQPGLRAVRLPLISADNPLAAVSRVAKEHPATRAFLVPLLHEARSEDKLKGKKFTHPDTGNMVQFGSLPPEMQKRIRSHSQEAARGGTKEDKNFDHGEHLKGYNMSIVGENKARAVHVAKKIKAGISAAADFCKVSPPSCEGNLGISRSSMPQVMNRSVKALLASDKVSDQKKGKAAVAAGADPKDDQPIIKGLLAALKSKGTSITKKKVPVGKLKATQSEIKAGKSFSMADAYFKGTFQPSKNYEIVVSSDGHILDGHHRWAALLLANPAATMDTVEVGLTMKEFLRKSFEHPGVFRADLHDNVVAKDAPSDLDESKGSKPAKKPKKANLALLY